MKKQKKMVTYFNRKDLVSFGSYMMSEKRKARFEEMDIEFPKGLPAKERLKQAHHADVENWIESKRNPSSQKIERLNFKLIMGHIEDICQHSLSKKTYESWMKISEELRSNHS